jgi:hypothetical protein
MRAGEDKGTFVQGRGYTSYHKVPKPVCMTRHLHGCPIDMPEPDPEVARCCFRPDYGTIRSRTKVKACSTCGEEAPGWAAKVLNGLPTLPGVKCQHPMDRRGFTGLIDWTECLECRGVWDKTAPAPYEAPNQTFDTLLERIEAVYSSVKESP